MDIANIKKVLNTAVPNAPSLRILGYACAADGFVYATDLKDTVALSLDNADIQGMINPKLINTKIGGFSTAFDTTVDEADFPKPNLEKIRRGERVNVPVEMLQDICSFLPYCSADESRGVLCGVCVRPFRVAAADGHVMLERNYECSFNKEEVVLSAHAVKLINAIGTPIQFWVFDDYAEITFHSGSVLYTKLAEGPYPNYEQVIPAAPAQRKVSVNVEELKAACQVLEGTMLSKCKLIILQRDEIFTYDTDNQRHFRVILSSDATPDLFDHKRAEGKEVLTETREYIGIDVRFFIQCLSEFSGSVDIEYGKSDISAITIRSNEKTVLVMPLRVGTSIDLEHSFSEIPPVYLDIETKKIPTKRLKLNKQIEVLVLDLQERIGVSNLKEILELI